MATLLALLRVLYLIIVKVMGVIGPSESFVFAPFPDQVVLPVCLVICNNGRGFAWHLMLIKLNGYSADPYTHVQSVTLFDERGW